MNGSDIYGFASQIAMTAANNYLAQSREEYARKQNYEYGEEAAKNADARTRKLYEDLYSPKAQIEHLRNAGLSPSLMYGGAGLGSSGQTGAQGTGAAGVSPTTYGMSALEAAQIDLIQAQTRKTNEEANTIGGENERGKAEIGKIIADTANVWSQKGANEASTALMNAQKYLTRVQTTTSLGKMNYEIAEATHNATKAYWEACNSKLTWDFNNDTYIERLNQVKEQVKLIIASQYKEQAEVEVMNKQIEYFDEQIKYLQTQANAAAANAENYGSYVDAYAKNLPEQIKLRGQELNVEKWKIGVDAFTELVRTAGYVAGASQLGDGGYYEEETDETQNYNGKGKPTSSSKHTHTSKKQKLPKVPKVR